MFLTTKQTTEYLNLTEKKVRTLLATGEIPSQFDGKKYITTKADCDEYINKFRNMTKNNSIKIREVFNVSN